MLQGIIAVLARNFAETARLRAYAAAFYAAAAIFLLFAFGFGLGALRNWIAVAYGAHYPDLWITAGLIVAAAAPAAAGLYLQQRKPKSHPATDIALIAGPPTIRIVARNINPRVIAIGVVLIAGVIVGRRLTR